MDGWMDGLLVGWFSCRSSSLVALYLFFCLSSYLSLDKRKVTVGGKVDR